LIHLYCYWFSRIFSNFVTYNISIFYDGQNFVPKLVEFVEKVDDFILSLKHYEEENIYEF